jgi:hypothetical protein
MRKATEPRVYKDGLICAAAIQRLALRDDVCSNCGSDATDEIGGYLVCKSARCQTVTRKIVKERERLGRKNVTA